MEECECLIGSQQCRYYGTLCLTYGRFDRRLAILLFRDAGRRRLELRGNTRVPEACGDNV